MFFNFFNLDVRSGFEIVNVTFLGIKNSPSDELIKSQEYLTPTIMHNT